MPPQQRALLIAMVGPTIQLVGFLWYAAHLLLHHLHRPFDPRHLFFEPAVLLVLAGFMVTVVCVPVALEVMRATPEDVAVRVFERVEREDEDRRRTRPRRTAEGTE